MKSTFRAMLLFTGLAVSGLLINAAAGRSMAGNQNDDDTQSKIQRGYMIAPVQLNLKGKNRALVGLGSYIVNAQGACNDCHTNPPYAVGGDPYLGQPEMINTAGYLAGGMPFGPFVSRNITPDQSGKPAGLTLYQFMEVLRTGIDLDHEHPQVSPLLQVMPWPVYRNMTDRDLKAVYEYLSSIPSIDNREN